MKLKTTAKDTKETGFKSTSLLWRIAVGITFVGLIIYVIGFSTTWWIIIHRHPRQEEDYSANYGLWRKCIQTVFKHNVTVVREWCTAVDNNSFYVPAAKVLCSLGLISCCSAFLLSLSLLMRHHNLIITVSGGMLICGVMLATVGAAMYADKLGEHELNVSPGYSIFFALIGCILLILGGGVHLMSTGGGYTSIN